MSRLNSLYIFIYKINTVKKSELQKLIREEIQSSLLVDRIYDALMTIDEFKKLGMDQQGEFTMQVEKLLKKFK